MYFEDIELNKEIPLGESVVYREQMLEFAHMYDPAPIHIDEEYAKNSRFGRLIAPGILTYMLNWAKWVKTGIPGEELLAGKNCLVEWIAPVYENDVLTGTAVVTNKEENNKYNGTITVVITAVNQNGELVLNSVSKPILKRRPAE